MEIVRKIVRTVNGFDANVGVNAELMPTEYRYIETCPAMCGNCSGLMGALAEAASRGLTCMPDVDCHLQVDDTYGQERVRAKTRIFCGTKEYINSTNSCPLGYLALQYKILSLENLVQKLPCDTESAG